MRVISGTKRGAKLAFIESETVRPTTDRVKESIFNMIQFGVRGSKVLDLFAGSGGLGIEALSRGADKAVFVDSGKETFGVLQKNLQKTGFTDGSICFFQSYESYLSAAKEPFDLIFLDPPYHKGLLDKSLSMIANNHLLSEEGLIVIECDGDEEFHIPASQFSVSKQARYGRVKITILNKIKE